MKRKNRDPKPRKPAAPPKPRKPVPPWEEAVEQMRRRRPPPGWPKPGEDPRAAPRTREK